MRIQIKYHEGASRLEGHGVMMDLAASETVELRKGEVKVIPLGVSMKLPEGLWGLVVPRSSTPLRHGILCANSAGVIENGYCGDGDVWGFVAYALRDTVIEQGTRIAQFMPVRQVDWDSIEFEEVETMPYPDRGGYGSTGASASVAHAEGKAAGGKRPKAARKAARALLRDLSKGTVCRDRHGSEVAVGDWVCFGEGWAQAGPVAKVYDSGLLTVRTPLVGSITVLGRLCTACPKGADGEPLLIGDTVLNGGATFRVEGYAAPEGDGQARIVCGDGHAYEAGLFAHGGPEDGAAGGPCDSREALVGDMGLSDEGCCAKRGIARREEPEGCMSAKDVDILCRALSLDKPGDGRG